jgi:hypothetical protein
MRYFLTVFLRCTHAHANIYWLHLLLLFIGVTLLTVTGHLNVGVPDG